MRRCHIPIWENGLAPTWIWPIWTLLFGLFLVFIISVLTHTMTHTIRLSSWISSWPIKECWIVAISGYLLLGILLETLVQVRVLKAFVSSHVLDQSVANCLLKETDTSLGFATTSTGPGILTRLCSWCFADCAWNVPWWQMGRLGTRLWGFGCRIVHWNAVWFTTCLDSFLLFFFKLVYTLS